MAVVRLERRLIENGWGRSIRDNIRFVLASQRRDASLMPRIFQVPSFAGRRKPDLLEPAADGSPDIPLLLLFRLTGISATGRGAGTRRRLHLVTLQRLP